MRAGDLRRRVLIQQRQSTLDSFGQRATTWVDVVPTWAEIQPLTGRELLTAQAINAEISHQITIRYRPGITAAMRVVYQGRNFAIVAPPADVDTRHKALTLMCAEGLTDGS